MLEVLKVFSWLFFCHLVGVFADTDAVKSVSVTEGDSVTLNTTLTQIQEVDQILWMFGPNRSLIAKISREPGISNTSNVADEGFRDRLKLDQTGSLTIMNTRTTDSGVYEVSIKNISSETKYRFSVTVNDPLLSVSSPLFVLISAAVVGSLLFLSTVGIFCIYNKYRKTDHEVQTRTEEITYADPVFYKRNTQKTKVKEEDEAVYARVVRKVDRTAL